MADDDRPSGAWYDSARRSSRQGDDACVGLLHRATTTTVDAASTGLDAARRSSRRAAEAVGKVGKGSVSLAGTAVGAAASAKERAAVAAKQAKEKAAGVAKSAADKLLEAQAEKLVAKMGGMVLNNIKQPYMPEALCRLADRAHAAVWTDVVAPHLVEMIVRDFGQENKESRKAALTGWAARPTVSRDGIVKTARALFLYATMPADGTLWKVLRPSHPGGLCVYAAKLHP
jgi:hypothetical protein